MHQIVTFEKLDLENVKCVCQMNDLINCQSKVIQKIFLFYIIY